MLLNDVRTLLITVQLQLSLYESCHRVYIRTLLLLHGEGALLLLHGEGALLLLHGEGDGTISNTVPITQHSTFSTISGTVPITQHSTFSTISGTVRIMEHPFSSVVDCSKIVQLVKYSICLTHNLHFMKLIQ